MWVQQQRGARSHKDAYQQERASVDTFATTLHLPCCLLDDLLEPSLLKHGLMALAAKSTFFTVGDRVSFA